MHDRPFGLTAPAADSEVRSKNPGKIPLYLLRPDPLRPVFCVRLHAVLFRFFATPPDFFRSRLNNLLTIFAFTFV